MFCIHGQAKHPTSKYLLTPSTSLPAEGRTESITPFPIGGGWKDRVPLYDKEGENTRETQKGKQKIKPRRRYKTWIPSFYLVHPGNLSFYRLTPMASHINRASNNPLGWRLTVSNVRNPFLICSALTHLLSFLGSIPRLYRLDLESQRNTISPLHPEHRRSSYSKEHCHQEKAI